jgi:hypothetical protein
MISISARRCFVAFALSGLLLGGCGTIGNDSRNTSFQAATFGYESALRWGRFESAFGYLDPDLRKDKELPTSLKGLRVTGYEIIPAPLAANESEELATQSAKIDYYYDDRNVLKSLVDHQTWRYDGKLNNWWLTTGLPKFK